MHLRRAQRRDQKDAAEVQRHHFAGQAEGTVPGVFETVTFCSFRGLANRESDHCPRFRILFHRLLEEGTNSDITFQIHDSVIHAHRCLLAARSQYFKEQLEGRWKGKRVVSIRNSLVIMKTSQMHQPIRLIILSSRLTPTPSGWYWNGSTRLR